MGKGQRVLIDFWHYSRRKKLSPKYVFVILLLEGVGFIHFPDKESGVFIIAVILIILLSWEIYEYSRERKDILRRAVIECPRGTDATRVRHGRIVGRNGVDIPEPDWLRPEYLGSREPIPPPIFRDDPDPVSVTCTSYTSTTCTDPPRRIAITNEEFRSLLEEEKEHKVPNLRKIREK